MRLLLRILAGIFVVGVALAQPLHDSYWIRDGAYSRQFNLAKDEIAFETSNHQHQRIEKVGSVSSPDDLRQYSQTREKQTGEHARLIFYENGQEHNAFTRRYLTDLIVAELKPGVQPRDIASGAGLKLVKKIGNQTAHYIFRASNGPTALAAMENLRTRSDIVSAEPLLAHVQQKRFIPNDPLFSQQWHLHNTGQNGGTAGIDANVTSVWDTYKGNGVHIGIVDDGVQQDHPDLQANIDASLEYDFNGQDTDPSPDPSNGDNHGTSVAGVAAGVGNNGVGVSGVAPNASLVGIRLIALPETDQDEHDAFVLHDDVIEVKSNSWGPFDNGQILEGPGPLALQGLADAVANGRGGKGTIFVWAAGNGKQQGDNSNYDGYANSIYTMAVSAVGDNGEQADYSEPGANITVAAPSSDDFHQGITTTDLTGNNGYNFSGASNELSDTNYTQEFGGTSSATPVVSGVVALMLQANPNLGWRDVREIVMKTATKINPTDSDWVTNSGGFHFNHKFGAGLVNAASAVALAQTWTNLPSQQSISSSDSTAVAIPDNNPTGVTKTLTFPSTNLRVEEVAVTVTITHPRRGDLAVTLTSPAGTVSQLAELHGDRNANYTNWTFTTVHNWGEGAQGDWKVKVSDLRGSNVGILKSVKVTIYGSPSAGQFAFSTANYSVSHDSGTATITVNRINGNAGSGSVNYSTADGTAVAGTDYTPASGTLTFADGETQKTFTVPISGSSTLGRTIQLSLSNPQGGPTLASLATATLTIVSHGQISLASDSTSTAVNIGTLHVPVQRTNGSTGSVSVQYTTVNGTAMMGAEFLKTSGTLTFADGQTSGTINIPIINTTGPSLDKSFQIVISSPTGGATLGAITTETITIQRHGDTTAPVVAIAYPPASIHLTNGLFNATGTASDNFALQAVNYRVNGSDSDYIPVTGSTNWTAAVSSGTGLIPGTNTFFVRATDYFGHSTVATRSFVYDKMEPFTVSVGTGGSVNPNYGSTNLIFGKTYSITATPANGYIFQHWTGSTNSASPALTFIMGTNYNLQASFIPNPFPALTGNYQGITQVTPLTNASAGYLSIVVGSTGSVSGKIVLGGTTFSLFGNFDGEGNYSKTLVRTGLPPVILALHLDFAGTDLITGTLTSDFNGSIVADRAVFNSTNNVAPQAGRYTFVILDSGQTNTPHGNGIGTAVITKAGAITASGQLSDGSSFSQSTYLSKTGAWPVYIPLYSNKGSISGTFQFTDNPGVSDFDGTMTWFRPPMVTSAYFKEGFTNVTTGIGSKFVTAKPILSVSTSSPNAAVTFTGGNLPATITASNLFYSTNNVLSVVGANTNHITSVISATTGQWSGSLFAPALNKTFSYHGVLFQKQNIGAGYFLGTNDVGSVDLQATP